MKWMLLFAFLWIPTESSHFDRALEYYQTGTQEKDTFLKNQAFNSAIENLLQENTLKSNVLMGESLTQLRQYPLALYYYLKALKKDPSNQEIRALLENTMLIGNLPKNMPPSDIFGPSPWVMARIILLLCVTLAIWIGFGHRLALLTSIPLFLILLYQLILIFRSPILAVTMHAQIPFQTASSEQSVSGTPIMAGSIVTVLDVVESGAWIKIRTSSGLMGYIPAHAARLVD